MAPNVRPIQAAKTTMAGVVWLPGVDLPLPMCTSHRMAAARAAAPLCRRGRCADKEIAGVNDRFKWTRLVAGGAAALLGMVLAGCSSTSAINVRQNPKATLQVWIRQPPGSDAAKTAERLVKAFSARTGVKAKSVALYEDFETKLQQQAAQRQLPDIVINDTAQLGTMQSQGWLEEIDRSTFPGGDQISDTAWKAAQAGNGRYYGVPFSAQTFAIFVRADWRAKLHIPEPKSWTDLANMATAFTERDPDGDGKADTYGLVIPGTTKRGYMSWYFSTYLWDNGGDFLEGVGPGGWRPVINEPKAVQAVAWLKDMFCTRKVVNPDAVSIDTPRAHDTFEKGIGGMYLTGPYMLPRFVKSMGSDKIEIFPVPNGPSGGPGALAEGENVYLTRGSPNKAGQRKFAEFATSAQGQTIGMDGDDAGPIVRLPVNKTVDLSSVRKDPRWKTFQDLYNRAGIYTPAVPNWTPFRQMSADSLNAIMANCGSNVKQELDKLAGQMATELKRQGALAS
jgi:multiple sugar transport system substrate-binding protein